MAKERPEIVRYLDYRQFLRDYFSYLAEKDRKFSQRWVAQKAGLKSPQLISMILKGDRKLSVENAQLLSYGLDFSEREEEYLLILLELESATHQEKQLEIIDRIRSQFQNGLFKDLPEAAYDYIKKWFYPATRELAAIRGFPMTAEAVARAFEIEVDDAREALELLKAGGFLKLSDGAWVRSEPSIKAPDFVSPLLMMQYHLQALERAFKAVQLKRELRHFDCLVVSLATRDLELVREKIRRFIREIDMLGETSARRDDVFQLNIQFFSLTGGHSQELLK